MLQVIDEAIFDLINITFHNDVFNFIIPLFSQIWLIWVGVFLCVVAYAVHCWRSSLEPVGRVLMLVLLMGLSVGVTDFSSSALKHSIGRDRPCEELLGANYYDVSTQKWAEVTQELAEEQRLGGSMPSSASAACMAVAVVLNSILHTSVT